MPKIYLSPSTQESNMFVNGGSEEYYMNLIADEMIPYLVSSGISYTRNTPEMTAASSIRQANEGYYDFYVSIHSNAAPESKSGTVRGSVVFYYPTSADGKRMADIMVTNLKRIYPIPSLVKSLPITTLGEISKSKAPAVLVEVAYHDNIEDATWIKSNIKNIAKNLVLSITQYFGIPLVEPQPPRAGTVTVGSGSLNIRSRPSITSTVLAHAYDGDKLIINGEWNGWYVVNYNGTIGYANSAYIK